MPLLMELMTFKVPDTSPKPMKSKFQKETKLFQDGWVTSKIFCRRTIAMECSLDTTSWADLALFHLIDIVLRTYPQSTESFPLIKAHYAQVAARPNIAKWLKSRPETPF